MVCSPPLFPFFQIIDEELSDETKKSFFVFLPEVYSILEKSVISTFPDFGYPRLKRIIENTLPDGKSIKDLITSSPYIELTKYDPKSE
jgi:hypothetical protein